MGECRILVICVYVFFYLLHLLKDYKLIFHFLPSVKDFFCSICYSDLYYSFRFPTKKKYPKSVRDFLMNLYLFTSTLLMAILLTYFLNKIKIGRKNKKKKSHGKIKHSSMFRCLFTT